MVNHPKNIATPCLVALDESSPAGFPFICFCTTSFTEFSLSFSFPTIVLSGPDKALLTRPTSHKSLFNRLFKAPVLAITFSPTFSLAVYRSLPFDRFHLGKCSTTMSSTSSPPSARRLSTNRGCMMPSSWSWPNIASSSQYPTPRSGVNSTLTFLIRIDIDDLMTHMRAIFSSHEDLFDQFCSFLPEQEQEQSCCPSALDFVSFVKARCVSTRPEMYHGFLALLTEVDRGQLAVPEVRIKFRLHQYAYRIHKMLNSRS